MALAQLSLWLALAQATLGQLNETRIGILLPLEYPTLRHAVLQAIQEINNKTDGVADDLLPRTTLRFAYRDSSKRIADTTSHRAHRTTLERLINKPISPQSATRPPR